METLTLSNRDRAHQMIVAKDKNQMYRAFKNYNMAHTPACQLDDEFGYDAECIMEEAKTLLTGFQKDICEKTLSNKWKLSEKQICLVVFIFFSF